MYFIGTPYAAAGDFFSDGPKTRAFLRGAAIAAALIAASGAASEARAQSVVSACSGVRLPASVVTSIVAPIAEGIVAPIEATVNLGFTTLEALPLIGSILPELSVDTAGILADAASGDPVTLSVIDADGTLVGPDDRCNLTADGYSLDVSGGIAIGGNTISGLGTGAIARSLASGSIAFGDGSLVTAEGTGGAAFGSGAEVRTVNGLALGAGSVALRTELGGAAGEVSFGTVGNERLLSNVADGILATDAVTKAQLDAVGGMAGSNLTAITDLEVRIGAHDIAMAGVNAALGAGMDTVTTLVEDNQDGIALNADLIADLTVDVQKNTGDIAANVTAIAELADSVAEQGGSVIANSAAIALNSGNIATNTDAIAALDGRVDINADAIAENAADIADNASAIVTVAADVDVNRLSIAENAANTTALEARVSVNEADIAAIEDTYVAYDNASADTVTLRGNAGTTISNVAAGEVGAASTDAVNGAQLAATNASVSETQANLDLLAGSIGLAGSAPVRYADEANPDAPNTGTATNIVTLVGSDRAAPVRMTNVAAGIAASDAATVGQVNAGMAATLQEAQRFARGLVDDLSFDLSELRRDSEAGTAGAIAIASMPQPINAGEAMVSFGVGHFRGESAFSVGAVKAGDDGRFMLRLTGGVDTRGNLSAGGGIGLGF
ncbi:YadA-like family protein [Pacificimonas sp. WHA3]|uniref:YadA-like family protein n=1 Tax=Pacificimonas pallii TaxID=2827236 RepID=A0ABS6SCK5_9SPHN|nr:YadA-like family protein [Pacificimonas pallii]MBV7255646.1 YadA-like family protein [Pacificimonas pallii]